MSKRGSSRRDVVDGLLLLNKPAGLSSNQALQRVKYKLNAQKAGHTGSLDPAATGMLPLCFGEATKVSAFLLDADKTYRVVARLGASTDSGDATGRITGQAEIPALSAERWRSILGSFEGPSEQIPPMYSALKKDGKRLYELAREGREIEREPRPIHLFSIEMLEIAGRRLVFRVRCSKGTYIRTLVEDIAARAGTVAYTEFLHRESVAQFDADAMVDFSVVTAAESPEALKKHLLAPDAALTALSSAHIGGEAAERFCGGQLVEADAGSPGLVRVYRSDNTFLGVGEFKRSGALAPKRVFKLPQADVAAKSGSDA